jgi:hypothetical protein
VKYTDDKPMAVPHGMEEVNKLQRNLNNIYKNQVPDEN